jgi:DNA-binding GntR family transcriptional regulator
MQFAPLAIVQKAGPTAISHFVFSPQIRAGSAAFRLFNGDVPPTLSIRDQVAVAVAERIVEQKLAPGMRIREQLFADEFNVSKAPVSEALMLLAYTGLVETSAHRGAFVSKISVEDFGELVEYRSTLARTFVPRYVETHTRQDQEVLQRYFAQMADLVSDDARAFEFVELTDRCLLFIAMRAGNGRITRAMSSLSLQLLRYFTMATRTVKQRRQLLNRWNEASKIMAARNSDQALAHFEQTTRIRGADIRTLIQEAA